jgi:hypothetical protein
MSIVFCNNGQNLCFINLITKQFTKQILVRIDKKVMVISHTYLKGKKRAIVFWLNPSILYSKKGSTKFFMLDNFVPRYPNFNVSLRLLHVRIDSFRVF